MMEIKRIELNRKKNNYEMVIIANGDIVLKFDLNTSQICDLYTESRSLIFKNY